MTAPNLARSVRSSPPRSVTWARRPLELGLAVLIAVTGASGRAIAQPADLILHGGAVITVDDRMPLAQAVAVRDGRILAVGSAADALALRGPSTRVIDLDGRAVLPGFIDAHGHLTSVAQVIGLANVASPPVGPVRDLAGLRAELERYRRERAIPSGGWVVGVGYDDSLLVERRHPTKADLDPGFLEQPVFLFHVSGHLGVGNSRALAALGYHAATPDPPGGVVRRVAGSVGVEGRGEPNGVLEESAFYPVYALLPQPTLEERLAQLVAAQREYASFGLTTAQDGLTNPAGLALLREAAAREQLMLDVVCYPTGRDLEKFDLAGDAFGRYDGRLKIGGAKLTLDGSPQGKTAFLGQPYLVPPEGQRAGYRGYPAMPQEQVDALVAALLERRVPILAHANGDAAGDQLLHALEAAARHKPLLDHRTVMIHAQVIRDDQLDRVRALGVIPSFFAAHSYYWGDWHRDSVLGVERAGRISPAQSAAARGIRFTFHNDAPVVPPDVIRLLWAGANRRTRSGDILGPRERISVAAALRAVTLDAAHQIFEESAKGSIEVGKVADLVVLSANPLAIDPEKLLELRVERTLSRGVEIYGADRR